MLYFDWDEHNTSHIARHRIEPHEAEEVLANDPLDLGAEIVNGEERYSFLGETGTGRILVVVVTFRAKRFRVVTAYKAIRIMVQTYLEAKYGRA